MKSRENEAKSKGDGLKSLEFHAIFNDFHPFSHRSRAKISLFFEISEEKIAPVVMERAGQASELVQDKAQALQSWLHDTAPARQEALEQAEMLFMSCGI